MSDKSKGRLGALPSQLDGARSVCDSEKRHGSHWQCARSLRGWIHIAFTWYQGSVHNLTVGTAGEDENATHVPDGDDDDDDDEDDDDDDDNTHEGPSTWISSYVQVGG
jgi:hypothetical protein